MAFTFSAADELCVNTIRTLSMDAVQEANSGHPVRPWDWLSWPMCCGPRFLKFDPEDPDWADRDRFVLSCGHGSMLLYALLHLSGYEVSLDDIKAFRQWGSLTPGHPEQGHTPGVEATTARWDRASAMRVGMALAERLLEQRFQGSGLVDHRTWVLASDGDIMEGGGGRSILTGRASGPGSSVRALRRQPHHHRWFHRPQLYRGCLPAL